MKNFIEISNSASKKVFQCEKVENGESSRAEIDLSLQAIIDSGISASIPRTLYLLMDKDPKELITVELGPFTYGITMTKVGTGLSFNPYFALTNEKKLLAELDEYEEDPGKKLSIIEKLAEGIKDEQFINTVIHHCKLDEFDAVKGEWVEKVNDADKGAELDSYSATLFIAIHIAAILHMLAKAKKQDETVKVEIPGEGTYTIGHGKNGFEIGFTAGKEFKQAIKNDRLASTLG